MHRFHRFAALAFLFGATATTARAQVIDPPARVGRLSEMDGPVSLYPSGAADWTDASLNYPLTAGDALWADLSARAEVQLGASTIRIAPETSMIFGEVSDSVTQVQLDQGSIDVHVRGLADGDVYEIDTPAGVISLLDQGHYRIDVTADGQRTTITVRDGGAQAQSGGSSYQLRARTSTTISESMDRPAISMAIAADAWEQWADERDRREDAASSSQYVSQDMVGAQNLDQYGTWQSDPDYGPVWTPRTVPAGWAPYRFGHWESIAPWGWTWIDDAQWGFAPFHYGRWAFVRGRWGWAPGRARVRPVYAPALVAFVGGDNWRLSALSGAGGAVGWIPLAPGERYNPGYQTSSAYLTRVNYGAADERRGYEGRNQAPGRYQNRNAPGAVTAVSRDAFTRSRPIAHAAIPVRPSEFTSARPTPVPSAAGQPTVSPRRPTEPGNDSAPPIPHPPGRANTAPPPPAQWHHRPRGTDSPGGQPQSGQTQQSRPLRVDQPTATPDRPGNTDGRQQPRQGRPDSFPGRQPRPSGPPATQPTPLPPPVTPPPAPDQSNGGRGRPGQRDSSLTRPPAGERPAPRPSGPPAPLPTQTPPPVQSAPPPATNPPSRMRPRSPEARPDAPPVQPDRNSNLDARRAQLAAQHQQEIAAMEQRHVAERAASKSADAAARIAQKQQQEKKALADKQQRQRDELEKQAHRPQ